MSINAPSGGSLILSDGTFPVKIGQKLQIVIRQKNDSKTQEFQLKSSDISFEIPPSFDGTYEITALKN
jgi:hypothetical protein